MPALVLKHAPHVSAAAHAHDHLLPGDFTNHRLYSHLRDEEKLRKDMAVYYGMTSFMDQQIVHILDRLDWLVGRAYRLHCC